MHDSPANAHTETRACAACDAWLTDGHEVVDGAYLCATCAIEYHLDRDDDTAAREVAREHAVAIVDCCRCGAMLASGRGTTLPDHVCGGQRAFGCGITFAARFTSAPLPSLPLPVPRPRL